MEWLFGENLELAELHLRADALLALGVVVLAYVVFRLVSRRLKK